MGKEGILTVQLTAHERELLRLMKRGYRLAIRNDAQQGVLVTPRRQYETAEITPVMLLNLVSAGYIVGQEFNFTLRSRRATMGILFSLTATGLAAVPPENLIEEYGWNLFGMAVVLASVVGFLLSSWAGAAFLCALASIASLCILGVMMITRRKRVEAKRTAGEVFIGSLMIVGFCWTYAATQNFGYAIGASFAAVAVVVTIQTRGGRRLP